MVKLCVRNGRPQNSKSCLLRRAGPRKTISMYSIKVIQGHNIYNGRLFGTSLHHLPLNKSIWDKMFSLRKLHIRRITRNHRIHCVMTNACSMYDFSPIDGSITISTFKLICEMMTDVASFDGIGLGCSKNCFAHFSKYFKTTVFFYNWRLF